jgi:excisionase family DNA binding protein
MGGDETLLTEAQAAKYLNVAVRTLVRWRQEGIGPPVRWARKSPRYSKTELDAWTRQRAEEDA